MLTIYENALRAAKARGARTGKEDALRKELGLDVLDRLGERELGEDDALALAVEAQHGMRPRRR